MLKLGRGQMNLQDFKDIIEARDCALANFAAPSHGLFLIEVSYPDDYFK
jgi:tRNA pseudouridine38-40 synthase